MPYSPPGVCRLIPARAGNMPGQFFRVGRLAAHPRSRGDHVSMNSPCGVSVGSSPLARGPRGILRPLCALAGLIPARAGTTVVCGSVAGVPGAHPRSRGEHSVLVRARAWSLGSSPLARGTHTNRDSSLYRVGLIPARAGTTFIKASALNLLGAHPRSRGDHPPRLPRPSLILGSSPLARGPRLLHGRHEPGSGLIPARAGTTRAAPLPPC